VILYEPELRFRRDVLVADLAGWAQVRAAPFDAIEVELAALWI
jgi:hypothetical protein